ncbi:unnamed protein product [Vitrella brassicaformis CCMP3155]|uniref:Sushi domain-containing protein n=5 Tax=Vitrella brassicaformis TaxID=1169539 RepID=A0A0G4F8W4_VITBC|nr:unnamed protein product [Vitrella brassicaformis CCMP3155]|eukprot:CEM08641.1 unnamed protein product [Vitrella brassicaformis CCMP3155]
MAVVSLTVVFVASCVPIVRGSGHADPSLLPRLSAAKVASATALSSRRASSTTIVSEAPEKPPCKCSSQSCDEAVASYEELDARPEDDRTEPDEEDTTHIERMTDFKEPEVKRKLSLKTNPKQLGPKMTHGGVNPLPTPEGVGNAMTSACSFTLANTTIFMAFRLKTDKPPSRRQTLLSTEAGLSIILEPLDHFKNHSRSTAASTPFAEGVTDEGGKEVGEGGGNSEDVDMLGMKVGLAWVGGDKTILTLTKETCKHFLQLWAFVLRVRADDEGKELVEYGVYKFNRRRDQLREVHDAALAAILKKPGRLTFGCTIYGTECLDGEVSFLHIRENAMKEENIIQSLDSYRSSPLELQGYCGDGTVQSDLEETCDWKVDSVNEFGSATCSCSCLKKCPQRPPLPQEKHLAIKAGHDTGRSYGSWRDIACAEAYSPADPCLPQQHIKCQRDGTWENIALKCKQMCPPYQDAPAPRFKTERDTEGVLPTDMMELAQIALNLQEDEAMQQQQPNTTDADEGDLLEKGTLESHGTALMISCNEEEGYAVAEGQIKETVNVTCIDGKFTRRSIECYKVCPPFINPDPLAYSVVTDHSVAHIKHKLTAAAAAANETAEGEEERLEEEEGEEVTLLQTTHTHRGDNVTYRHGAAVIVSCKRHYLSVTGNANNRVVCDSGKWVGFSLDCQPECPPFPKPVEPNLLCAHCLDNATFPFGSTVQLRCDAGHSPATGAQPESVYCTNGQWVPKERALTCAKDCEQPEVPVPIDRYYMTGEGTRHGNTRTVHCASGLHDPRGISKEQIQCLNGKFTKHSLLCLRDCAPLNDTKALPREVILVPEFTGQAAKHGEKYRAVCHPGFSAAGRDSQELVCLDGTFTSLSLVCARDCPAFPELTARYNVTFSPPGTDDEFSSLADLNYTIPTDLLPTKPPTPPTPSTTPPPVRGPTQRTKEGEDFSSGFGGPPSAMLTLGQTPAGEAPLFDPASPPEAAHGTQAIVRCLEGMEGKSGMTEEKLECNNGLWAPKTLVCAARCGPFVHLDERRYAVMPTEGGGEYHGAWRIVSCKAGFYSASTVEQQTVSCIGGKLDTVTLLCEAECPIFPNVGAHYLVKSDGSRRHGAEVEVSCCSTCEVTAGETPQTIKCYKGEWMPLLLKCEYGCPEIDWLPLGYEVSYLQPTKKSNKTATEATDAATAFLSVSHTASIQKWAAGGPSRHRQHRQQHNSRRAPRLIQVRDTDMGTATATDSEHMSAWDMDLRRIMGGNGVVSYLPADYTKGGKPQHALVECGEEYIDLNDKHRDIISCVDGQWTRIDLNCRKCHEYILTEPGYRLIYPSTPAPTNHGNRTNTSTALVEFGQSPTSHHLPPGTKRIIECVEPFESIGQPQGKVECVDGRWTPKDIECRLSCGDYTPKPGQCLWNRTLAGCQDYNQYLDNIVAHQQALRPRPNRTARPTPALIQEQEQQPPGPGGEVRGGKHPTDPTSGTKGGKGQVKGGKHGGREHDHRGGNKTAAGREFHHGTILDVHSNCQQFGTLPDEYVVEKYDNGVYAGAKRTVRCAAGYEVSWRINRTEETLSCRKGYWTFHSLVCKDKCPAPPKPEHGLAIIDGQHSRLAEGSYRAYGCSEGYTADPALGDYPIFCINKKWTPLNLKCTKNCPVLDLQALDYMVDPPGGMVTHGSQKTVSCLRTNDTAFYNVSGPNPDYTECNDGRWTMISLKCERTCPEVRLAMGYVFLKKGAMPTSNTTEEEEAAMGEITEGGSSKEGWVMPGESRTVGCHVANGYSTPQGVNVHTTVVACHRGKFSNINLKCYKKCGLFPAPEERYEVSAEHNSTKHGARRLVKCRTASGFFNRENPLDNQEEVQCEDGKWQALVLNCQPRCPAYQNETGYKVATGYLVEPNDLQAKSDDEEMSLREAEEGAALPDNKTKWGLFPGAERILDCGPNHMPDELVTETGQKVLPGKDRVYCDNGRWTSKVIICKRMCSEYRGPQEGAGGGEERYKVYRDTELKDLISLTPIGAQGITQTAKPLPPGTMRYITCKEPYEPLFSPGRATDGGVVFDQVECLDGRWSRPALKCQMPCDEGYDNILYNLCVEYHVSQTTRGNQAEAREKCNSGASPYKIAKTLVPSQLPATFPNGTTVTRAPQTQGQVKAAIRRPGTLHLVTCDTRAQFAPVAAWPRDWAGVMRLNEGYNEKPRVTRVVCSDGKWAPNPLPFRCAVGCVGSWDPARLELDNDHYLFWWVEPVDTDDPRKAGFLRTKRCNDQAGRIEDIAPEQQRQLEEAVSGGGGGGGGESEVMTEGTLLLQLSQTAEEEADIREGLEEYQMKQEAKQARQLLLEKRRQRNTAARRRDYTHKATGEGVFDLLEPDRDFNARVSLRREQMALKPLNISTPQGEPLGLAPKLCRAEDQLVPRARTYSMWGPGCCDAANCWRPKNDLAGDRCEKSRAEKRLYGEGTFVAIECLDPQRSVGPRVLRHFSEPPASDAPRPTNKTGTVFFHMCNDGKWIGPKPDCCADYRILKTGYPDETSIACE